MIEHSLFFHPDVVDNVFDELKNKIKNGDPVTIRRSTKKTDGPYDEETMKWNNVYLSNKLENITVELDKDGNSEVRRIIRAYTSTSVSIGKNSDLKFGKISHIWGETSNPLFFTSLWNVVIVPAYFNDILDKNDDVDVRIKNVKNLYKAICWKLYDIEAKLKEMGLGKTDYEKYVPEIDVNLDEYQLTFIPSKNVSSVGGKKVSQFTLVGGRKVGQLAKEDLRDVLEHSPKVKQKDIDNLQDKAKCKQLFGISFPVLAVAPADPRRYYKDPVTTQWGQYYLCSQWYESNRPGLEDWINKHK